VEEFCFFVLRYKAYCFGVFPEVQYHTIPDSAKAFITKSNSFPVCHIVSIGCDLSFFSGNEILSAGYSFDFLHNLSENNISLHLIYTVIV